MALIHSGLDASEITRALSLVGRMLVAAVPPSLLLWISVNSRLDVLNPDLQTGATVFDDRISAYVDPVRKVQNLRLGRVDQADEASVVGVADLWIARAKSGKLRDLLPQDAGDTTDFGAKNEIRDSAQDLSNALLKLAMLHGNRRENSKATQLGMKAIEVTSVLMSSDFSAYASSLALTREVYRSISQWNQAAPDSLRRETTEQLLRIESHGVSLSKMLRRQVDAVLRNTITGDYSAEPNSSGIERLIAILDSSENSASIRLEFAKILELVPDDIAVIAHAGKTCWTRDLLRKQELMALLRELGFNGALPRKGMLPAPSMGSPRR